MKLSKLLLSIGETLFWLIKIFLCAVLGYSSKFIIYKLNSPMFGWGYAVGVSYFVAIFLYVLLENVGVKKGK